MTELLTPALKEKFAQLGSSQTFVMTRREALLVREHIAQLEAKLASAPTAPAAAPLLSAMQTAAPFDPTKIMNDVLAEVRSAHDAHGYYYSAHHGYGVLCEELKELFDDICVNQSRRDLDHMRKEAVQVAACAARIAAMIDVGRGRV